MVILENCLLHLCGRVSLTHNYDNVLAFVHVQCVGQPTWNAVMEMVQVGVMSKVDKVWLVQNEILGYVYSTPQFRSHQYYRIQVLERLLYNQHTSDTRAVVLEFIWGIKVYNLNKLLERAQQIFCKDGEDGLGKIPVHADQVLRAIERTD